ncbi:hypothetical protein [Microbacterium sp. 2FI]|uniref:hypothetical protein n=1 Tax=Microbacterium sp. 2FI TaxID=2502193 RepID=UPI002016665C|nr:hypothetical protein [Microbacterium sp. 2FI]
MHHALAALARAAATLNPSLNSTPTPTPTPQVDPALVTPGPWGFAVIVFIALAVILLVWDMMRRIRRGRVRADIQEELDAEMHAQADAEAAAQRDAGATAPTEESGAPGDAPRTPLS